MTEQESNDLLKLQEFRRDLIKIRDNLLATSESARKQIEADIADYSARIDAAWSVLNEH
jgi:hypothetical protein